LKVIGLLDDWDEGSQDTERQRDGKRGEDATMWNESKNHRKYANMYLIDCRMRDESSDCSGLEQRRRDKG
jgi:hypothetical protein